MAVEKKTALGPILYPTLWTAYNLVGAGMGFLAGAAIATGVSFLATCVGEGAFRLLDIPVPPDQDFASVFLKVGIPTSAVAGLVGGAIGSGSARAEFHRDFRRKSSRRG